MKTRRARLNKDLSGLRWVARSWWWSTGGLVVPWLLLGMHAEADTRLSNISTRGVVGTDDNVMIGGFVIRGALPVKVVVRGVGPSIPSGFVAPDEQLGNPRLDLFSSAGEIIARNDNWQDDPAAAQIPPQLQPLHPDESAVTLALPPGAYTAIVSGVGGTTGVGLVEVFELTPAGETRFINISTRARVETGDRVAIGGLIVSGNTPRSYVLRARAGSIPATAVAPGDLLADPVLQLFRDTTLIDENDDWENHPDAAAIPSIYRPQRPEEAAILVTLDPGSYTGIVSGADGGQGIAIVEVFEVTVDLADLSPGADLPLESLTLPSGFHIGLFARVTNPRQMAHGADGTIYVGSFEAGAVHAVQDLDFDGRAEAIHTIDTGLDNPTGVAWRDGDLFVAAVHRILRYPNIDARLTNPPEPEIVTASLPHDAHHGWKVLGFGPDGLLYTNVGAPCNVCERDAIYATIVRLDADASGTPPVTIVASGVRNTVGFDWHPGTGQLWFTDNGRDWLGDFMPPDELNRVSALGEHFGFPHINGNAMLDPDFGSGHNPDSYTAPELELGPHVAALGMAFYSGFAFPGAYVNQMFIAEHGSWNRSQTAGHTGYRITLAREQSPGKLVYETFIEGWLGANNEVWGRPADVITMPDGSLLIADDRADALYRVTFTP